VSDPNEFQIDMDALTSDAVTPTPPVVVDSRQTPAEPRGLNEDDFPDVNWGGDLMCQRAETDAMIDKDALFREIARLSPEDAKTFDNYCEHFDPNNLPRNAMAWYKTRDDITKMTWLYGRWIRMRNHLRLAGYEPVNTLLGKDRLCRALQCALENPTTPLASLPGFALSERQQTQVRHALLDSPQLCKLWPDVVERFRTEELVAHEESSYI
jgi:hypothetical protein